MPSQPLSRQHLTGLVSGFVVSDQPSVMERAQAASLAVSARVSRDAEAARMRAVARLDQFRALGFGQAARRSLSALAIIAAVWSLQLWTLARKTVQAIDFAAIVHALRRAWVNSRRWRGIIAVPLRLLPWRWLALAGGIALGATALLTRLPEPIETLTESIPATEAAPDSRQQLSWTEVRRPISQFALESPELSRLSPQQGARRHPAGGREEILLWGNPVEPGIFSQLVVSRPGAEGVVNATLFIDTARRAALSGLSVLRSSAPAPVESKFGAFEAAEIQLGSGTGERPCMAFRRQDAEAKLNISGWYCGAEGKLADRLTLRCFIDRLSLIRSGEDVDLRGLFATAERGKAACAGARRMTGSKTTWLDAEGKQPALKTAFNADRK